jgi:hypothetical protein
LNDRKKLISKFGFTFGQIISNYIPLFFSDFDEILKRTKIKVMFVDLHYLLILVTKLSRIKKIDINFVEQGKRAECRGKRK